MATASATAFLNFEDEHGLVNVIVSKGMLAATRAGGAHCVVADKLVEFWIVAPIMSRDFRLNQPFVAPRMRSWPQRLRVGPGAGRPFCRRARVGTLQG